MKIELEYGKKAFCLPQISHELLMRAGKTELKVLIALASEREFEDYETLADALTEKLKISRNALDGALSFWIGAGIVSRSHNENGTDVQTTQNVRDTETVDKSAAKTEVPKRTRVTELPMYTSEEFAQVLERRKELKELIEGVQIELGKVLNITETQLLVSISEGLGVDDEYILSLFAYCKKIGKCNMRYVEKTAISLYDKGICTAVQLDEYLKEVDRAASAEGRIRRIFGIGDRAFTSKESKTINDWVNTYGFDFDMIKCAYEETINATSKPSVAYAGKVLESWFSEGLKTPDDVKRAKEKRNGGGNSAQATSFNVDDFFNAAINKGFGTDGQGG